MQVVHVAALMEALQVLVWCQGSVYTGTVSDRYLFISKPHYQQVSYVRLPTAKPTFGRNAPKWKVEDLISLPSNPTGLAVDQKRRILYVAVPSKKAVLGYQIKFANGKPQVDGEAFVAVQDVETFWVACDGLGSLFVTDEAGGRILKVHARDVIQRKPTPTVIYDNNGSPKVSNPGGLAVDNFHVYWGNKVLGTQEGSVVKGFELPVNPEEPDPESVRAIASNVDKVHGVCLAQNNIFFSVPKNALYAVDKQGSENATAVHTNFHSPRGCSWDGDGTVFVADHGANAILSFAGNMQKLGAARVSKMVEVAAPFDVAVMSCAGFNTLAMITLMVAMMLLM